MELTNRTWPDGELLEKHKEVLQWWPTGAKVDLDEPVRFHRQLPEHEVFARKLDRLRSEDVKTIQVGLGHATIEQTDRHCHSVHEGIGLPTPQANVASIKAGMQTRRMSAGQSLADIEMAISDFHALSAR